MGFLSRRSKATKIPKIDHPPSLGPTPEAINLYAVRVRSCRNGKRGYGVFASIPLTDTDSNPFIFEVPMYSFSKEPGPWQKSLIQQWAISEKHLRDNLKQHFPELDKPGVRTSSPWRGISLKLCERDRAFISVPGVKHIYRLASQIARGCSKCANVRAKVDKQCPHIISMYPLKPIEVGEQIVLLTPRRAMFYEHCRRDRIITEVQSL